MAMPAASANASARASSSSVKLGRPLLVGQVEVAVDVVAHLHRDAEERRHRWMVGRKSVAAGVFFEVDEPQRAAP